MKPATGVGHYLRDIVGGANDGVITTMAIVAGVEGASLAANVAIVLGIANLLADGFSMGASGYLALRSELDQLGIPAAVERPERHGAATMAAFVAAGAVPLGGFAIAPEGRRLLASAVCAAITLAVVGGARARFVRRSPLVCSLEMLLVGGVACVAAWTVGFLADAITR